MSHFATARAAVEWRNSMFDKKMVFLALSDSPDALFGISQEAVLRAVVPMALQADAQKSGPFQAVVESIQATAAPHFAAYCSQSGYSATAAPPTAFIDILIPLLLPQMEQMLPKLIEMLLSGCKK